MKLDTTEAVLEWADSEYDDPETAARLALAMRVLAIVERDAATQTGGSYVHLNTLLAEASAEKGDGK